MASVITATVSSGLTQSADNSGVLQLASGTGNLVTVPSVTGTAMVSGNIPAFSAYVGTAQSISAGVTTKVALTAEEFDTANCFDSTTNYRFTPNVAGYYLFTGQTENQSGGGARIALQIFKNGTGAKYGTDLGLPSGNWASAGGITITTLIYMNGTTDYVDMRLYDSGGQTIAAGPVQSYFQGFLVRTA